MSSTGDTKSCRICLEEENDGDDMIAPCKCDGTCKWVHRECLDKWRIGKFGMDPFYTCPNCHFKYEFEEHIETKEYRKLVLSFTLSTFCIVMAVLSFSSVCVWFITKFLVLIHEDDDKSVTFMHELPWGILYYMCMVGFIIGCAHTCAESRDGEEFRFLAHLCSTNDELGHMLFLAAIIMFIFIGFYIIITSAVYFISGYVINNRFNVWKQKLSKKLRVKDQNKKTIIV